MDRVRERSKRLVGGQYRLEIANAIHKADGAPFSALEIADATGIRYPRVQEDLKRLAEADMIVEQARTGGSVPYVARQSIYWDLCSRLLAESRATE